MSHFEMSTDLVIAVLIGGIVIYRILFTIVATTFLAGCGNGFDSSQSNTTLTTGACCGLFTIGALGDSISRGYDITALGVEDLDDNWVTGINLPGSLVNDFQNAYASQNVGVSVSALNLAVTGDSVLGSNSTFAAHAAQLAQDNVQLITIEIGANDVCQGNLATATDVANFQAQMISVLTTLTQSASKPTIVVTSIPHIWALTQITTLASNPMCTAAWSVACPNLSAGQTTFEAQWTAANQALQAAVKAVGATAFFDGAAVADTAFTAADVSTVDCFHPSVSGQTKIANAIWAGFQADF